ncbi:MAG: COX15/CtaA family protein [Pelagibacteraceae bacterium]
MTENNKFNYHIIFWLISLITLTSLIIIVGGLTRLTDSGLSITEWDVFSGIIPPFNETKWNEYFDLYKNTSQYNLLNSSMTLPEFKIIFWWEFIHRILARSLGLLFLIPLIYFYFKKVFSKKTIFNLLIIFLLIILQGTIGWYMVKSGLIDNVTVSHFRLSLHLSLAFIILSSIFWFFLNYISNTDASIFFTKKLLVLKVLFFLIFLQIALGALVSGLDAGRLYQTWPLMNGNYVPEDFIVDFSEPGFVQFIHRNLAYLIFIFSLYLYFYINKFMPEMILKFFYIYFSLILIQIALGIYVLISGFNFYVASAHQISSIFLILSFLKLLHSSLISKY